MIFQQARLINGQSLSTHCGAAITLSELRLRTQLKWRQYTFGSLWQFAKYSVAWALPIEFACGWEQMKWKSNYNIKLCSDCNTQYGYTRYTLYYFFFLACFVRKKLRQGARQGWDLRELADRQKTFSACFYSVLFFSFVGLPLLLSNRSSCKSNTVIVAATAAHVPHLSGQEQWWRRPSAQQFKVWPQKLEREMLWPHKCCL